MRFNTLPEWLAWQENLHFTEVDPGLERVEQVWQQLAGDATLPFKVITIAGTNGKGSSVAMLDSILRAAGYRTGTYTSPHLLSYNERIAVNGQACDDVAICDAFEQIDQARGSVSLTYFEFSTLAAVTIFCEEAIDIAILEVGMGGRLDAVNLFDADIALITPVSLDHVQWLGSDRETIGFEKAGIIRANKPLVCAESQPPESVLDYANTLNAVLSVATVDFSYQLEAQQWHWSNATIAWRDLPHPALAGRYQLQNAAAVLQIISLLIDQGFSISQLQIEQGLIQVELAGRFQQIPGPVMRIFDVTHNQQGALNLAELLKLSPCHGRTIAVLAMLKDKDVLTVSTILEPVIDLWHISGLTGSRGMSAETLALQLADVIDDDKVNTFDTVPEAYAQAMAVAEEGDRVLIFGSFHTVESVMSLYSEIVL
jgi:dihydrofolate synthase/folylpolyglutamate synthase